MTGRVKSSDELYAEVIHVPCPRCLAAVDAPCVNQITEEAARVPHWQRVRAAEEVDQDPPGNSPHSSAPATGRPV